MYRLPRVETKRSDFPSGAQLGVPARTLSGSCVTCRGSPPSAGIRYTWVAPWPARSDVKAIHLPSGEGAGSDSRVVSEVIAVKVVA